MKEQSMNMTNAMVSFFDLPKDIFLGMSNIYLCSNREIYISNHRGILSYGSEEMVILMKDFSVQFKGKSLSITAYSKDELTIVGYILSIVFLV